MLDDTLPDWQEAGHHHPRNCPKKAVKMACEQSGSMRRVLSKLRDKFMRATWWRTISEVGKEAFPSPAWIARERHHGFGACSPSPHPRPSNQRPHGGRECPGQLNQSRSPGTQTNLPNVNMDARQEEVGWTARSESIRAAVT